jgi:hypothetical protein
LLRVAHVEHRGGVFHQAGIRLIDIVLSNLRQVVSASSFNERLLTFSLDHFQFKDSFAFLGASLEKLVKLNEYTKGEKQPNWDGNFHNTRVLLNDFVSCLADFDVLTYPYNCMNEMETFYEKQLPPKEAFHNDLADEACPDELFAWDQDVWDRFNCQTLGECVPVY